MSDNPFDSTASDADGYHADGYYADGYDADWSDPCRNGDRFAADSYPEEHSTSEHFAGDHSTSDHSTRDASCEGHSFGGRAASRLADLESLLMQSCEPPRASGAFRQRVLEAGHSARRERSRNRRRLGGVVIAGCLLLTLTWSRPLSTAGGPLALAEHWLANVRMSAGRGGAGAETARVAAVDGLRRSPVRSPGNFDIERSPIPQTDWQLVEALIRQRERTAAILHEAFVA